MILQPVTTSRRSFLYYSTLLLAGMAGGCQLGNRSHSNPLGDLKTLRFSVSDEPNESILVERYNPFRKIMERVLGVNVSFVPMANQVAAASALELEQVDLMLVGPTEYIAVIARTLAQPLIGISRPNYYSVIAVPVDSEIETLSDLKGKSVALSDVGSTSGYIGPATLLIQSGLNVLEEVDLQMLGDEGSIEAMRAGKVSAWGGSLTDYKDNLDASKQFKIIQKTDLLPGDILVSSRKIYDEFPNILKDKLFANESKLVGALSQTQTKYEGSKLKEVEEQDYQGIRESYKILGEEALL